MPGATRTLAAPRRARTLAEVLVRFSPIALGCVIALVATGVVQSVLYVERPEALWSTAFGRAVIVKVGLLAGLVALGAYQRRRMVPAMRRLAAAGKPPGGAGRVLRDVLCAEVTLTAAVLAVTATLVSYPPPDASARGPWSTTRRIGPQTLEATLDPAAVGRNELHLYLLDARTGAPFDGAEELTVAATLPERRIGPIDATPRKAGPGHHVAAPAAASAHVTVQPTQAPAGGFARLDVRVPNERDNAGTTKVAVKMPPGVYAVSYEPKPGWEVDIERRPLAEPAELHGEPVTEEVDTVTFTGDGKRGSRFRPVGAGARRQAGRQAHVPRDADLRER